MTCQRCGKSMQYLTTNYHADGSIWYVCKCNLSGGCLWEGKTSVRP